MTNILLAFLGVCSGLLAARILGPAGRGELAAIQTSPVFIAVLAMLGMPEALAYYVAKNPEKIGEYLTSGVFVVLAMAVTFVVAGYYGMPYILKSQNAEVIYAARTYLFVIFIYALIGLPHGVLRGLGDYNAWNLIRPLPALLWIMVLVVLGWIYKSHDPISFAYSYLIILTAIGWPLTWMVVRKRIYGKLKFRPHLLRPLLKYGLPSVGAGLPQALNMRLPLIIMAAFLPARDLGLYVVAVAWSGAAMPLTSAVAMVAMPHMARSDSARQWRDMIRIARGGAGISVGLGIVFAISTPWALPWLFGRQYMSAVLPALILTLGAVFLGWNQIIEECIRGLNCPNKVLLAELLGMLVMNMLLYVWMKPLGIKGAALATLAGYGAVSVVLSIYLTKFKKLLISGRTAVGAGNESC